MAVLKLIFPGLHPQRIAMDSNDSAKPKTLITKLLWRIEVILSLLIEDLHSRSDLVVSFNVSYDWQIVKRGRSDPIENVDFYQFILQLYVNGVDTFRTDTLDYAYLA